MQKIQVWEKGYVWNLCENGIYLASIKADSTFICDEVIESCDEEIKTIPTKFNEEKVTCKTQGLYILLAFLLVTITLLISFSIYCNLIKYQAKNVLPFHYTKLKQFCISIN